jgi:hypothetical protein
MRKSVKKKFMLLHLFSIRVIDLIEWKIFAMSILGNTYFLVLEVSKMLIINEKKAPRNRIWCAQTNCDEEWIIFKNWADPPKWVFIDKWVLEWAEIVKKRLKINVVVNWLWDVKSIGVINAVAKCDNRQWKVVLEYLNIWIGLQ